MEKLKNYVNYKVFYSVVIVLVAINLFTLVIMWLNKPPHHDERFDGREMSDKDGRKKPPPPNEVGGFFTKELGWSKEQEEKFEEPRKRFFTAFQSLSDSINTQRKLLYAELFKEAQNNNQPKDTAAVKAITEKIGQYQQKIDQLRFDHFNEVAAICNDEQRQKFKKVLEEVFLKHPTPESGNGNGAPPPPPGDMPPKGELPPNGEPPPR